MRENDVVLYFIGPSQKFLDSRQKNLCIVRLCNIIICADVQAHQLVKIAVSAGKYNDRKIGFLSDFSAYLETILIGQIDV